MDLISTDLDQALNYEIQHMDFDKKIKIKDFLKELLLHLWREEECFNGKRPFGNSGWQSSFYLGLIEGGFISGEIKRDEDDCILDYQYDDEEAQSFAMSLIYRIFETTHSKNMTNE